jgi:HPt (histidine-containing phosphotransfer) domain-containing protein
MNESNELIELDVDLLNEYAQSLGYPIVKKMFSLYEQQVVIYLKDIEESLHTGNVQLWQARCHKMKGAAGSVGLKALYTRLKNMEKTNENKDGRAQQLADLNMHNKQAMAEFTHWLASL